MDVLELDLLDSESQTDNSEILDEMHLDLDNLKQVFADVKQAKYCLCKVVGGGICCQSIDCCQENISYRRYMTPLSVS